MLAACLPCRGGDGGSASGCFKFNRKIAKICAEILNFKRSVDMKFYKSVKFKALAGTLLLIIILCAAFVRIILDFSTSRGFAIVTIFRHYVANTPGIINFTNKVLVSHRQQNWYSSQLSCRRHF